MKILHAALIISLMLFSSATLAERGSSKDNRITYPDSSPTHQDRDIRRFSPSDLTDRNP